ncbi:MAG: CrcB family protein [Methylacidiphilales bacterium]|nr:CrcB family protein [Candidatus Methylacidiphilales bacterium]
MKESFYIFIFGGLGCLMRYQVSQWCNYLPTFNFPIGVLTVNILGSMLAGLALGTSLKYIELQPTIKIIVMVGFLGGFTTFSSFSYELYQLYSTNILHATAYLLTSVLGGLVAFFIGMRFLLL